jgi:hypothetical protein
MDASSTAAPALEAAAIDVPETKPPNAKSLSNPDTVTASDKLRKFTDAALKFLSNASNETLGACAVGLCASTYLVLGRVGLVLIGAVGGIVLHATWEGSNDDGYGAEKGSQRSPTRRKELGIEVAKRVLDWRDRTRLSQEAAEDEDVKVEASVATRFLDYSEFKPATGAALTLLTEAVVRDYVKYI